MISFEHVVKYDSELVEEVHVGLWKGIAQCKFVISIRSGVTVWDEDEEALVPIPLEMVGLWISSSSYNQADVDWQDAEPDEWVRCEAVEVTTIEYQEL